MSWNWVEMYWRPIDENIVRRPKPHPENMCYNWHHPRRLNVEHRRIEIDLKPPVIDHSPLWFWANPRPKPIPIVITEYLVSGRS